LDENIFDDMASDGEGPYPSGAEEMRRQAADHLAEENRKKKIGAGSEEGESHE
jgi:hypothetical protein